MISCIYIIKSILKPDRFYIGSALDYKNRRAKHIRQLLTKRHHSITMQRHYDKYGADDLVFEVLEMVDKRENLVSREQYYLDTMNPYFNTQKVAGSMLGYKHTQETKDKISVRSKELMKDPARREMARISSTGNKNCLGHKHSDERRKKNAETRTGIPRKEETKRKISQFNKGKTIPEWHRKRISEARKEFFRSNPKSVAIIEMLKQFNINRQKSVV